MTDYSKSSIYKIACKDPAIDDIYIGSTTNLIKRRNSHKHDCININSDRYNSYVYRFIREHGNWCNWDVYLIKEFKCNTKMQKSQVERAYIESLKPKLNKNVPANFQTGDIWDQKEYCKRYKEKNNDIIVENNKAYRESHKEQIKQLKQQTIHCNYCNHMINLSHRTRHNRTKKHISNYSTSESSTSEEEQYTIIDEINKLHDDNELKLQEIQNTCYEIDKLIN